MPSARDYIVSVNADVSEVEVILVPEIDDEVNPAGVKGFGELGDVGTNAAVANAVYYASDHQFSGVQPLSGRNSCTSGDGIPTERSRRPGSK